MAGFDYHQPCARCGDEGFIFNNSGEALYPCNLCASRIWVIARRKGLMTTSEIIAYLDQLIDVRSLDGNPLDNGANHVDRG